MKKVKSTEDRIVGSGITKRRKKFDAVTYSSEAAFQNPEEVLVTIEIKSETDWAHFSRRIMEKAYSIPEEERANGKEFESEGWYAGKVIQLDETVRKLITECRAEEAAIAAARWGGYAKEIGLKLAWEKYALSGEKSAVGAAAGAKIARNKRHAIVTAKHDALRAEYGRLLELGCKEDFSLRKAAKKVGYSIKQAKRILLPKN